MSHAPVISDHDRASLVEPVARPKLHDHARKLIKRAVTLVIALAAGGSVIGGLLGYWNAWKTYESEIIASPRDPAISKSYWKRVRLVAESKSIPLPDNLTINTDLKGVQHKFKNYVGAWIIQGRWGGTGRQSLLIVQNIEATGRASGIYAGGPPTPTAFAQIPAFFRPFAGTISDAGLTFPDADFQDTFTLIEPDILSGFVEKTSDRRIQSRALFERIP